MLQAQAGVASTELSLWAEFAVVAGFTLVTHPSLVALALILPPDGVFHCWREGALVLPGYSWEDEAHATRLMPQLRAVWKTLKPAFMKLSQAAEVDRWPSPGWEPK